MSENDDPEGFTLLEALEQIAGPETWEAYLQRVADIARRRRSKVVVRPSIDTPAWGAREWSRPRPRPRRVAPSRDALMLEEQLEKAEAELKRRLGSRELIATAYEAPVRLDSERRPIPAELWGKAAINFGRSSARWYELELRDIRVQENPERAQGGSGAGREPIAETAPSGEARPGPRSFIPEAEEEMRAMAKAGELTGSLKRDSHVIADRVAARFPGEKVCTAKTIHNRLNKLYRELHQEQRARINLGDF